MKRIYILYIIAAAAILIFLGVTFSSKRKKEEVIIAPKPVFYKEAESAFNSGDFLKARALFQQALETAEGVEELNKIQGKIEMVNMKIIFSPVLDECSIQYEVRPNDALAKIAKKFKTTVNLIKRANNLQSDTIRPGQKLKVNNCRFSISVDKSMNILFLKQNDQVIKKYIVSTGKNNNTPVGQFKIVNKEVEPTWFRSGAVIPPDSPDNILGSRWMGFDLKGYGIHGTTAPEDLGKQVTLGCIRMKNEEVEELFDIIPVGTEVVIVD